MNKKVLLPLILGIGLLSTSIIGLSIKNTEQTTLQISEINGGIGGVTAVIENTGDMTAENFAISVFVEGGVTGNIDVTQVCTGCGNCGTTIPAGEIKAESTRESGFIIGFGPIDIMVTASAANADLVSEAATGFVIGPFIIV